MASMRTLHLILKVSLLRNKKGTYLLILLFDCELQWFMYFWKSEYFQLCFKTGSDGVSIPIGANNQGTVGERPALLTS